MAQRKKIVAGNWKMNLGFDEAVTLVKGVMECSRGVKDVERIIFPPFPYLHTVRELLVEETGFFAGAQNCSEHAKGAYTGEVSAQMLKDVGCHYVLVGHSERRSYFKEDDGQLKGKIGQVLASEMKVVFCFGEQLNERRSGKHFDTVKKQIEAVLRDFPRKDISSLVLAYEPVWAIGTGETASPAQAQEMHSFVRGAVAGLFGKEAAQSMSLLYGGSCNAQNAAELFACPDVDGGLIGGASLKAADFCTIIRSF